MSWAAVKMSEGRSGFSLSTVWQAPVMWWCLHYNVRSWKYKHTSTWICIRNVSTSLTNDIISPFSLWRGYFMQTLTALCVKVALSDAHVKRPHDHVSPVVVFFNKGHIQSNRCWCFLIHTFLIYNVSVSVPFSVPVPGHSSVNYQLQEARSRLSKTVDHVLRDNMAIPHFMHFTELRGIDHLVRFWLEAESFRSTSWSRIRAHSLNSVKHSTLAEPILPSQDGSEGQEAIQPGTEVKGGTGDSLAAQPKLQNSSSSEPGSRPATPQTDTPTSRPSSRTGTPNKTNSTTRDISDKLMKSERSCLCFIVPCTLCCDASIRLFQLPLLLLLLHNCFCIACRRCGLPSNDGVLVCFQV